MPFPRTSWFRIREELPPRRAALLTALSFLLPLAAWCFVSYTPWVWHPDVRLDVSADRTGIATVYKAGDHVAKDFFPEFAEAVRRENAAVRESMTHGGSVRDNLKTLRHLADLAVAHGWLRDDQRSDDAALLRIWRGVALGELVAAKPPLSAENLDIIRKNWRTLDEGGNGLDPAAVPAQPLLRLVPQGRPANPVYLPAPHRVLTTGYRDFRAKPDGAAPTMGQRVGQSLGIVYGGFLLACVVGVPIGVLCGTYGVVSRLCEPFVDFFRYMPAPAFSTLLVAVFAAHAAPKIALVFIGTFFQLVLVVANTTRGLDRSLLEAAQTLGAGSRQLLGRVVVPGILPDLYNDLRILLGWAWTWLVIAELVGVKTGLTEVIDTQGRFRNFDSVFPVIILIGLMGFVTDQILAWLRGVVFPWTGESDRFKRAFGRAIAFVPVTVAEGARERAASYAQMPRRPSASSIPSRS